MDRLVSVAQRYDADLLVRDKNDSYCMVNATARKTYSFFDFDGRHATYDNIFRATLIRGINVALMAQSDHDGRLMAIKAKQRRVHRYSFIKTHPNMRYMCQHELLEDGMCALVRIPLDALGIVSWLPKDDREISIDDVMTLHDMHMRLTAVTENLPTGIGLLHADHTVQWANQALRRVMERGDGLTRDSAGRLIPTGDCRREWDAALDAARNGEKLIVLKGADGNPLVVALEGAGDGLTAIRVSPRSQAMTMVSTIRDVLNITQAEAEVIASVVDGKATSAIATERDVRESTVVTQIKNVISKGKGRFGRPGRAALVRLAADMAAVHVKSSG
jgi:PAS domain-containing protein